ncbi:MAG: hypothetical protein IJZ90_01975 [Clostridia bacterium]|nr:hypothetical protein [Clostridia bacterium]
MKEANINLSFVLNVLVKNIIWILLAAFLGGGIAYGYARHTAVTRYTSSVKFLVRNFTMNEYSALEEYAAVGLSASSISASKSLIGTYIEVIKTEDALDMFLEDVKANDGYKEKLTYTYSDDEVAVAGDNWIENIDTGDIKSSLTLGAVGDTEILQIDVTFSDARQSEAVALAIENVLPSVINQLYDIGSVRVIESATTPVRESTQTLQTTLIGTAVACVFSAAIFFLIAYLDNTIKCEEDIKVLFGVLALGEVPDLQEADKYRGIYDYGYVYNTDTAEKKEDK